MKVYFLSSRPCALTLNDAYFGITDGFERFAEISLKDRIFAKFTPENALPVGFFLTENLRFSPPEGCEIYLLPDGIAVYARDFPPCDLSLKTIAQKREGDVLATVFRQGVLQLSIESGYGFFISPLPPSFAVCTIGFSDGLIVLKAPDALALYTKKGECVFCESVLAYEMENGVLKVTLPLSDSLGRIAECSYDLDENGCTRTAFSLRQARSSDGDTDKEKIRDELLPFAFFESVLIGANYAEMLSDELAPKAGDIRAFLGDFVAVAPTRDSRICALVRKKGDRLFETVHCTVELKNGKIVDIKA